LGQLSLAHRRLKSSCDAPPATCDGHFPTCDGAQPTCDAPNRSCDGQHSTCDALQASCDASFPTCDGLWTGCDDQDPICDAKNAFATAFPDFQVVKKRQLRLIWLTATVPTGPDARGGPASTEIPPALRGRRLGF
jgi:hypothetical protein